MRLFLNYIVDSSPIAFVAAIFLCDLQRSSRFYECHTVIEVSGINYGRLVFHDDEGHRLCFSPGPTDNKLGLT
jgi:hypothetical protein